GGGSSDAAAAIRALARAYDLPVGSLADLHERAARIGADVPVCLVARAAWMRGVGERVTPLTSLPKLYAVLVNPGVKLSTREVFQRLNAAPLGASSGEPELPAGFSTFDELIVFVDRHPNDLE